MADLGRILVLVGVLLLVVGGLLVMLPRLGLPLGKLPGDFRFQLGQFTCFVPLATTILLSVILTLGLNLLARFLGR
ncbi:MAG: DUF2905 domain-containing protein [Anaerolineales bacterium]